LVAGFAVRGIAGLAVAAAGDGHGEEAEG
jgi:hypothetical protein